MDTMLIELTNHKAAKLLKDLEDLNIIKVIKRDVKAPAKLSSKYRGIMTSKQSESLKAHITEMRDEWKDI